MLGNFLILHEYWLPHPENWSNGHTCAQDNLCIHSLDRSLLSAHTVHGFLKARILKWFATPFYTGPHFVLPWLAATFPSATSCSWMTCRAPCLFHCWSSLSVETFTGHWMLVNVLPRGWSTGSTGVTRKGFHGRWNCCWKMPRSWGHPSLSAAIGHG